MTIREKAAAKAHRTMAGYTGKDLKALEQSRHLAAVKAWKTRNAKKNPAKAQSAPLRKAA